MTEATSYRFIFCLLANFIKRLIISAVRVLFSVVVEELQQQLTQSSTQREEIIRLKQELQLLRRDLAVSGTLNYDTANLNYLFE